MAYRIERDHFGGHIEEDREWELAGFVELNSSLSLKQDFAVLK